MTALGGDAGDEAVATRAAELAERAGPLAGWVNNAAVFRDAALHEVGPRAVLALVALNLGLAVTGCAVAVRRFLAADRAGAIVNVSSHQAQRAVPGALPYATAKAAVEGLTRALAVDYGPRGIRTNAVALGSIVTERYEARLDEPLRALHPLRRTGRAERGRSGRRAPALAAGELRQRRRDPGRRRPRRARAGSRGARRRPVTVMRRHVARGRARPADRLRHLRARGDAELGEDVGEVALDGLLGQEQPARDLAVRAAERDVLRDLALARGSGARACGARPGAAGGRPPGARAGAAPGPPRRDSAPRRRPRAPPRHG